MSFDSGEAVARLLHHRGASIGPGEPIVLPIVQASVYYLPETSDAPHQYGRWSNPTWSAVEEAIAILEDADVVAFPSGMAAVTAVFQSVLKPGDRLLLPSDGYFVPRYLAEKHLAPLGIEVDHCPTAECETRDLAGYRMVLVETPSNPGLDIADLRALAGRAKAAGALLVADNTTMTPLGQRPLDLGADVVLASDTKALNGHSDVLFGHVASRDRELIAAILDWRKCVGAIPGPLDAWLVHRGIETLELRLERMCASASVLAERLAAHPAVEGVRYPGLADHPRHALAARQMLRFGSVIGLTLPDANMAERFISGAALLVPATSFGGLRSSAERRARWGDDVAEGYIRLSVGCEPAETLWADIRRALDAL